MKWIYKQIIFLLLAVTLVACQEEPSRPYPFELNLCLPAQNSAAYGPRRAIGDPGCDEIFALPKYAYIFIMKQDGATWSTWKKEEMILDVEKWEKTTYSGVLNDPGNDIYKYNKKIQFLLADDKPKGKIYVICSNKRLTFTPSFTSVSNLEDVLNLKFNTAPDSIQKNLQNIYSTPYNYTKYGDYYCMYDCSEGNTFVVDLLLYHVAAKVDIKWNVQEEKRINKADRENAVRLTYMEARNLFNGDAYCFKPMRNESATKLATGATVKITENDEGLWWEGRSYFYTIPYTITDDGKQYYPLQMTLKTNGSAGTGYQPTLNLRIDTAAVFVPWLRANFNLSAPLSAGTPTKTVDY